MIERPVEEATRGLFTTLRDSFSQAFRVKQSYSNLQCNKYICRGFRHIVHTEKRYLPTTKVSRDSKTTKTIKKPVSNKVQKPNMSSWKSFDCHWVERNLNRSQRWPITCRTPGAPCRTFGRRFYRAEASVEEIIVGLTSCLSHSHLLHLHM